MARGRRPRNREHEQWIANQHAGALGINRVDNPDLMMQLIDRKGGDYYRADLHPNPAAWEAYEMLPYTAKRTPLQEEIVQEMRGYYGYTGPGIEPTTPTISRELVSEASQRPAEALYQAASARVGPPAQHPASNNISGASFQDPRMSTNLEVARRGSYQNPILDPFADAATVPQRSAQQPLGPQTNAYPESMPAGPSPQQQAAIDLKDDYVNHTVGYDVQQRYNDILGESNIDARIQELEDGQWITGSQTGDLALLGGSALLAGGGIGRATAPKEEEEYLLR